jgi:hypothetical protein
MSLQAIKAVRASRLEPRLRSLALVLASYAHSKTGRIFPGIQRIAQDLGVKESQAYDLLRDLRATQVVQRIGCHHRTRCFTYDYTQLAAYQPAGAKPNRSRSAAATPSLPAHVTSSPPEVTTAHVTSSPPERNLQSTGNPILISEMKEVKKNLLTYVPVPPLTLAASTSKPSKPSKSITAEATKDHDGTNDLAEIDATTDALLSTFKALYFEQRGEPYRERTTDRDKACELALTHDPTDLCTMVQTMLTEDAGGDAWVAKSDRSISVLYHRAESLLKVVKQVQSQPPSPGVEWGAVLTQLKGRLPTYAFHQWFGSTHQAACVGNVLHVAVESDEQRGWIRRHYTAQLQAALTDAAIGVSRIEFVILARRPDVERTG